MKRRVLLLLLGAACMLAAPAPARAQSFNAQEQAEIRAVVRDYLVRNPDVLREALDALEARVRAERREQIENDPRDFSMGPADAPITIVEFFDYRCQYCHAALSWVSDIVRDRDDVRVVFKEFPLLGPASLEASRAAVAAMPQGRYWQFHRKLLTHRGQLDSARIDALAREAGVDVARMRARMDDEAVTVHLRDNHALAFESEINSTPTFMINGEFVTGFDRPRLDELVREARRAQRTAQR